MRGAVYNGDDSAPAWTSLFIGDSRGISFDPHRNAHSPSVLSWNNRLVAHWHEEHPVTGRGAIRGALYTPPESGNHGWTFIDGGTGSGLNRVPGVDAEWCRTAVVGDVLFAAWSEATTQGYRIRLSALFDPGEPWREVDTNGLNYYTDSNGDVPHLASYQGKLYITWSEKGGGSFQTRVMVVEHS